MHVKCSCKTPLHFSSASDPSNLRKQSSRADFVLGQAQQLGLGQAFSRQVIRGGEHEHDDGLRLQALGIERVLLGVSRVISYLFWFPCWRPEGSDLEKRTSLSSEIR